MVETARTVVVPRGDLAAAVEQLQGAPHVIAVLFGESSVAERTAAVERRWEAPPSGLAHVAVVEEPRSERVVDYADKTRCMANILAFIAERGASAAERARVEQCIDEMMMNALYDAPVDADGKHIFDGVPTRQRIKLRTDQAVTVTYGFERRRFAICVRDTFGSLRRETVVRHLHKALHAANVVDRKAGGAGLGLYLVATAATAVVFDVVPGVSTEVACAFDLGPSDLALDELAFLARARTDAKPTAARRRLARDGVIRRFIGGGAAIAVLALAVVFVPRLLALTHTSLVIETTRAATVELDGRVVGVARDGRIDIDDLEPGRTYRVVARLDGHGTRRARVVAERGSRTVALALEPHAVVQLASNPSDAIVKIGGHPVGTTPLQLDELAPDTTVKIELVRPGYRSSTASVKVPPRGQRARFEYELAPDPDAVRVQFTSDPPGASIVRDGRSSADRTYTPAEVFVIAGEAQRFSLEMPDRDALVIEPFTPARGVGVLQKGGEIP